VRIHDAWARSCRKLILLSAQGGITTLGGISLPRSSQVASHQSPLDALKPMYPNRHFWEPKWFDTGKAIEAAQKLQIANFPTVSAGLGSSGHAPDELRACRNYIAHRNQVSNDELDGARAHWGLPSSSTAEQLMNTAVTGGAPLFELWWRDLLLRFTAAVQ